MWLASSLLGLAITIEVAATAALPSADGFTRPGWTAFVLGGYAVSIWLMAVVVRTLPVSVVYAVWSGAGTALVAVVGVAFLHDRLDALKVIGILAIIAGVVALNLTPSH